MTMKRNILHTFWTAALLLTACTQEEFILSGINDATPLAITITDGGYARHASADGLQEAATRAAENGYRTKFTAGDVCGLYIVRNDEIALANLKLTATAGTDGSLTWQPEAGATLAGGLAGEQYFIYYPYQAGMSSNKINASATTDDASFFAPLIDDWRWDLETDQTDYAGYTASDLMTAKGTAVRDGKQLKLSFSMTHRMALVVIEMPGTVYKFTNTTGGAIPDYTVSVTADFTSKYKPYRSVDGSYRYIVSPNMNKAGVITGMYAEGMKMFAFAPNGISSGEYRTYKVNDAQTVEKRHNLQIGDYLLADGSLVSKDELTEEQKASVAAVVFWTPAETDYNDPARQTPARLTDDKIMTTDFPNCTHGLAVALNDVDGSTTSWQRPYFEKSVAKEFQYTEHFKHAQKDDFRSLGSDVDNDSYPNFPMDFILGYQNTVVLRAYNEYCHNNNKANDVVHAVEAIDDYVRQHPAPAGSTGWFLPSAKELYILCDKDRDNIWKNVYQKNTFLKVNESLKELGNNAKEVGIYESPGWRYDGIYWTSSEEGISDYATTFCVVFSKGYVDANLKHLGSFVRAVCAF